METQKCCICGNEFYGYGNDPYPIKEEGRCCDTCNGAVILERIRQLQNVNELAKMAARKVTNEVIKANELKGEQGVKEVLKKYDMEDIKIEGGDVLSA